MSPVERIVYDALTKTGLKFWREYPIEKFRYDFAIPSLKLIIESDSWTYHHDRESRDTIKTELAHSKGWKVCRLLPCKKSKLARQVTDLVLEQDANARI